MTSHARLGLPDFHSDAVSVTWDSFFGRHTTKLGPLTVELDHDSARRLYGQLGASLVTAELGADTVPEDAREQLATLLRELRFNGDGTAADRIEGVISAVGIEVSNR
ncbi:hypothetical protein [Nocardia cyriacigeorgica]|uniref:hypothetical protein n=1 Tax=Nocardia cyriacigeorgica TaxID=135487 RepID=UPI00245482CF|nr:hypothetical protein [Nocardia cyriacigeorgica]